MQVKLTAGKYRIPVELDYQEERIFFKFRYNKPMLAEVKMFDGARWHGFDTPPKKVWSISNTPGNDFRLRRLKGENPYAWYDREVIRHTYKRPLYEHQCTLTDEQLTYHYHVAAADCGVGKTLCAIEAVEFVRPKAAWYIAPRSALKAVTYEFKKWKCEVPFKMLTYEGLVKEIKLRDDEPSWVPQFVVFDEASKCKNATAQRSQAARILAELVRKYWDRDGYVLEMTGTPAPKDPTDWHHLTEIACPGFLREGNKAKFKQTLSVQSKQDSPYGGSFYQLISWRDDEKKCDVCGDYAGMHDMEDNDHDFKPSVNEVFRLSRRLKGLVSIRRKEDCLELPDKIYRRVELPPSEMMMQVAQTILETASTTISGLTLLRELSDGFQYRDIPDGMETCPVCSGSKRVPNPLRGEEGEDETTLCDGCGGIGTRKKYKRIADEVECPKDEALKDCFDEFNDVGRLVIYGGFTGSIDRIVKLTEACGWQWIRVDGRGWHSNVDGDHIENFQDNLVDIPKLAFIGHPGSAGMGLTLTASPAIVYYSNDFNAENRMQSMDRCHRPGMDVNRGCTIIDLLHLPTDYLILENLMKKFDLQNLSLGKMQKAMETGAIR